MKLAKAAIKEVPMEENAAAYGLRGTAETSLAHGLRSEKQEYPTEQVIESVRYFNSDPQQSPLLECESILNNGYLDIIKTD